jgi:hypothetical protein
MADATPVVRDLGGDLTIYYDDDPDDHRAGHGLQTIPLMNQALRRPDLLYWEMSPAEQCAMVFLLENLRPKVAIEIGTRFGGSLQVLSQFCGFVYSIDVDTEVPKRLAGKFPNVEFMIGSSVELLPPLLEKLQREHAELGFALVDGDHSTDGVRQDIDNLMKITPVVPFYITMHDSLNPNCRRGLRQAKWAGNPYMRAVELDFVPGAVNPAPAFRDQMWGGLALGIMMPEKRTGRFEITAKAERTFQTVVGAQQGSLLRRAAGKAKRMILGAK